MDILRRKIQVPELGRRFSIKERRQIEREFFGRKWRKRGDISKEQYEERLKKLTSQRLKAKTTEDKKLIKRKIKYLKKITRPILKQLEREKQ